MKIRKLLLMVPMWAITLSALAYDAMGHRIISDIAYTHLTKKARKQCDAVLGTRGIIYASTWADEVRSDKKYDYSYKWHYQNLKDSLTLTDLEALFRNPTAEGEHLFFAIEQMKERIRNDKNDAEALKFLVHFMADLHQPMHLGRAEDLGANKIKMKWFGKETNLHAVWDGMLTEGQKMSYTEYSQFLQDKFSNNKAQKQNESLLQSVYEVYKLRTEVYAYGADDKNNYLYIYNFSKRNDEMLYAAGLQLAKTLNSLY